MQTLNLELEDKEKKLKIYSSDFVTCILQSKGLWGGEGSTCSSTRCRRRSAKCWVFDATRSLQHLLRLPPRFQDKQEAARLRQHGQ